jgi:hypothetical protein
MKIRITLILAGLLLLIIAGDAALDANAQGGLGACPAIVDRALAAVDQYCEGTGRNQVCYGNIRLEAEPQPGIDDFTFSTTGDIVNVADIRTLSLSGMNQESGEWGVALMRLQANIPDTLPGQNVTFIMFGDVSITSAVEPEALAAGQATPMQAFYLTTGIGDAQCNEAPESGLLVQTPQGIGEVAFTVNGIDMQIGSTVLLQGQPDTELTVTVFEGSAVMNSDEGTIPVVAGSRMRVELEPVIEATAPPDQPAGPEVTPEIRPIERPILRPRGLEPYEFDLPDVMPLNLLERRIEPRPPLNDSEIELAQSRIESGQPLCGVAPFPPCDNLPVSAGGSACVPAVDTRAPISRGAQLCDPGILPPIAEQTALPDFQPEATNETGQARRPSPTPTGRQRPTLTPTIGRQRPTETLPPRAATATAIVVTAPPRATATPQPRATATPQPRPTETPQPRPTDPPPTDAPRATDPPTPEPTAVGRGVEVTAQT